MYCPRTWRGTMAGGCEALVVLPGFGIRCRRRHDCGQFFARLFFVRTSAELGLHGTGHGQASGVRRRQHHTGAFGDQSHEGGRTEADSFSFDDPLNLGRHLVRALGSTLGRHDRGEALVGQAPGQAGHGVAVATERSGDVHVRGQIGARQHSDTRSFGALVVGVVDLDGHGPEEHGPLPVGVEQPQTLADRRARHHRVFEQRQGDGRIMADSHAFILPNAASRVVAICTMNYGACVWARCPDI